MTVHTDSPPVKNVRADYDAEAYVITHDDGSVSGLGFDLCLDRIDRYELELGVEPQATFARGAVAAFGYMRGLVAALEARFESTGEPAVAELSPQLTGLEDQVVLAVDEEGDEPREFKVGTTTGFMPHHVELTSSTRPARRDYWRIEVVGL